MMADFVDQHMAHDMLEALAAFRPIIQERPAVEVDHIDIVAHIMDALVADRHALIEAEEIERRLQSHVLHDFGRGELLDPDAHLVGARPQDVGNRLIGLGGDLLDIADIGRFAAGRAHGPYLGAMRSAPSRRITVPLR